MTEVDIRKIHVPSVITELPVSVIDVPIATEPARRNVAGVRIVGNDVNRPPNPMPYTLARRFATLPAAELSGEGFLLPVFNLHRLYPLHC